MLEALIVVAVLGVMAAIGAAAMLPWDTLLSAGTWLCAAGFGFGVPAGVVYHVLLYRTLAPRGELDRGWIWRPLDQHDKLRGRERRVVVGWAIAGAAGFGVIVLGIVAMALSVVSVQLHGV